MPELPGQGTLQELLVLTDGIHQQVEVLLDSIGLLKEGLRHRRGQQREGSKIHHLQAATQQQGSQLWVL